jgi:leucyl aminopeptidase
MLEVDATQGDLTERAADAIVVNLFEGVIQPGGGTGAVDAALEGRIRDLIQTEDLTGEDGETAVLYPGEGIPADRVVVAGLGPREGFDLDAVRRAAGRSIAALSGTEAAEVATIVHGAGAGGLGAREAARAIAVGAIGRSWGFDRSTDGEDEALERLTLLEVDADAVPAVEAGAREGARIARSQATTRELTSISGDEAAPAEIAERVRQEAREAGLEVTVWGPGRLREEGMGGVLGVSRGSHREPRFVRLDWEPPEAEAAVCLCGKGVTFDTGGISLKSRSGMDGMRYDKGGAAAVVGALLAAARLELPVRVVGLTPLVENMPGGRAIKPGDVIEMRSGTTVEVLNTDAEGRLILADTLDLAGELDVDHVVDLATLTGSVKSALGTQAAGLMGDDEDLLEALEEAAEAARERVWRLPMYEEYEDQLDHGVSDLTNVDRTSNAGCIVAGTFLKHFAPDGRWAHLDIAGIAWNDDQPYLNPAYTGSGATGAPVRTLVAWLEDLAGTR